MKWALAVIIGIAAIGAWLPHAVDAQAPVAVTVQELIKGDHRLAVTAGTEVLWRDPHFERVWFPQGADARASSGRRSASGRSSRGPAPIVVASRSSAATAATTSTR